jgi:hypothetical protein
MLGGQIARLLDVGQPSGPLLDGRDEPRAEVLAREPLPVALTVRREGLCHLVQRPLNCPRRLLAPELSRQDLGYDSCVFAPGG